ncbi:uncharacterized protein LOC134837381 [Culicoides brevitarsis]|uniref:uncharacterized protein LOC134837381 n=1 Tax=Culicoides brevitarsis TaxID=469753 RepID=UPI00307BAE5D
MSKFEKEIKFSEEIVVPKILASNPELKSLKLVSAKAETENHVDGFMGTIVFLNLLFEDNGKQIEQKVIVKLMKPASRMRDLVRADVQFINEVYIYRDVIPTFLQKFRSNLKTIHPTLWCPAIFLSEVGFYPQLSNEKETLLVLENLRPSGFRLASHRIDLTPEELTIMTKAIAQYHAFSYAMRVNRDPDLDKLMAGIVPLGFERENGRCLYDAMYEVAMDRIFEYLEANPEELDSEDFKRNILIFKKRYAKTPLKLMERFRRQDPVFSAILHGDFNRNNVLFKYEKKHGSEIPVDFRMIDFQEVRYGSPAIDLAFNYFMNMKPEFIRAGLMMTMLKHYHSTLIEAMAELLNCEKNDSRLEAYNWNNFFNHFKEFAFYGVMVSIHFVPWMASPVEECAKLADLFEQDMNSKEFYALSLTAGGKPVNQRITENLRYASKMGFMEMIGNEN